MTAATIERVVEMTLAEPPGDGKGRRGEPSQRAAHLGGARPEAAPGPHLQVVE